MTGIEEDVAALGDLLGSWDLNEWRGEIAEAFDRLAAKMPQRALSARGRPLWLHEVCGTVQDDIDSSCRTCEIRCDWQPLYVLGEVSET